jgi:phosphoribosylglycinamide formyltransferase 1
MIKLAILASGSGSNAENIARYFQNHPKIEVSLILSNKKDAFVLERAKNLQIPAFTFNRHEFYETNEVLNLLTQFQVDWIILAGFLWLIPDNLIEKYNNRMVNIHPALLPKYGGKGMYGEKVHQAVVENRETESGITIHKVNQHYDEGQVVFQAKCKVEPNDNAEQVAAKVHVLEYQHFPKVIEKLVLGYPID